MGIQQQVIVITGASSGFGELIARRCATAGARLVLAARTTDKLEQLAAELGGPQRAIAVPTDVTSDDDVARMIERAIGHFGRIDVLVNNAGFGLLDRIADAPLADLQHMMDVNVYGAIRCTRAVLPHMLARRNGQIVMMASLGGLVWAENMGYYVGTKFALVGISRTLMVELGGSGVHCALICPGIARTGFQQYADEAKYPRLSRLSTVSAEKVAQATEQAIARRLHGELIIPWYGRILATAAAVFPGMARIVMRLLR
ncbi:MAG TPA: SDR family NAD(P)-dependent oxidoreductase [Roseiflexaceae bacterium]|nr:SDR family NAD(P)-dependent oxidoreductase [Roseiflexaceae bacterium]HMP39961.1 SDR family NAD(P)-dependent oxidoreductase [Roseiflexaceae bacterium]